MRAQRRRDVRVRVLSALRHAPRQNVRQRNAHLRHVHGPRRAVLGFPQLQSRSHLAAGVQHAVRRQGQTRQRDAHGVHARAVSRRARLSQGGAQTSHAARVPRVHGRLGVHAPQRGERGAALQHSNGGVGVFVAPRGAQHAARHNARIQVAHHVHRGPPGLRALGQVHAVRHQRPQPHARGSQGGVPARRHGNLKAAPPRHKADGRVRRGGRACRVRNQQRHNGGVQRAAHGHVHVHGLYVRGQVHARLGGVPYRAHQRLHLRVRREVRLLQHVQRVRVGVVPQRQRNGEQGGVCGVCVLP